MYLSISCQSLSGNQTITSAGGDFKLGFFTPGKSRNYHVGIWYAKLPDQTVVWVANRQQPVSNLTSSALKLLENGNLVLLNQSKAIMWSTGSKSVAPNSTVTMLLDSGNLVIRDALDSSKILWQSFDYPTDHWLPGGKLGYNNLTKEKQKISPWRSSQNPAPALFSLEVEQDGTSHLLLWNESERYWTSGEWTGKVFTEVPELQLNYYVRNMTYISNENESYYTYSAAIPSAYTRFLLDVTGQLKQFVWQKSSNRWDLFWTRPPQECEVYAFCGPFSICNQDKAPLCFCPEGFETEAPGDWEMGDHTGGCTRRTPLQCDNGGTDTFLVIPNMRFPSNPESSTAKTIEECEKECSTNCSCNAFAYDSGCSIWKGDVFNLQQLPSDDKAGREFHIRISASDLRGNGVKETRGKVKGKIAWIVVAAVAGFLTLFAFVLVLLWRKQSTSDFEPVDDNFLLFKYQELRTATKNFSEKLGEGGFGTVYKGTLPNSTAIAVKKLKNLKQGEKQFRAEVKTVGSIQHINLVRVRGICVEGSQRLLVYDYMPNGSLETTLFRKTAKVLDWNERYHIAVGTARGLAYLHEKCRECIIHCDIKPENILLDPDYKPKLADFGLAKLIGRDFSRVLTTMRGTRGYLAPEWISGEAITTKADVFSYGMLLFEVISGRRNSEQLDDEMDIYFPFRVANIIDKGEDVVQLLDDRLDGNTNIEELNKACRVACWCIQENEKDRPSMGQVVQLLEGLSEVGAPPIPRFLLGLSENPDEAIRFQETSSSSTLTGSN
ncbi:G-type lectin S-receptor-like serine/threonine-protein kinase At2g19130 isoform X2 [Tripterygium wilfordii]|uniref:G-type lectin S-receptor-like serine/threonine-protein kinase At2g19130 isoform X2 n=1 Tax=Tripterygium wilfordii TaxID=458696 RepID=UPI0018F83F32|nr:G-type lectin S-receptor-like serine/threonine-protein kinase At2g19130 isoform X2 [Tripterygium wilfordii]